MEDEAGAPEVDVGFVRNDGDVLERESLEFEHAPRNVAAAAVDPNTFASHPNASRRSMIPESESSTSSVAAYRCIQLRSAIHPGSREWGLTRRSPQRVEPNRPQSRTPVGSADHGHATKRADASSLRPNPVHAIPNDRTGFALLAMRAGPFRPRSRGLTRTAMPLGAGGWELVAALVVVTIAATIQGAIGFGINLMVVPVLAVLIPGSVPGSMVLLSIPMTLTMLLREHQSIDWVGVRWIALGRLPGTAIGIAVVSVVPAAELSIIVGGAIVLGVVLSAVHPGIAVNRRHAFGAGAIAGVTNTTASVDGPPLALLYQRSEPHTLRATLATSFLIGATVSATALAVAGKLAAEQLELTALLLPAVGLGLLASGPLARRVSPQSLRPFVLAFATVAGIVAIVRGIASI